ncbi:helix-turn-helix transcriptional regulator [Bradyrhizobium jicamae]|uniref:helix-turn-helix domain-containing protein n=1 Tax=Bradyrhizobium jicamae TaxID=280332 RepID=UPI001BA59E8C|nr:AraC family transcriptional regulator [Bradyrhizobium jicamae]MBR0751712.1 helix-turn-helix transcriptional regulator [Bradyrhizobium jicamae]
MSFRAVELGVHGAACGLFLLLAGLAWRDRRQTKGGLLTAALMVSTAASIINSVPGFQQAGVLWRAPMLGLSAGGPAVFWLWARVVFDDDFVPRARHAVPWMLLVVGIWLSAYGDGIREGVAHAAERPVQLAAMLFAILAVAQTTATWRNDLVQGRRRLRVVILLAAVLFIVVNTIYDIGGFAVTPAVIDTIRATAQIALAVLTAWAMLQVAPVGPAAAMLPPARDEAALAVEPKALPQGVNPVLLKRLAQVMTEERIFRQERLTIGALASRLAVPEERLRRAINEGLGYRNFNAFINHYRLEDAKSALSDPSQNDVPVLTIAMDAGFQSLGPFNRAFKADTGMTPTEYRRKALGTAD